MLISFYSLHWTGIHSSCYQAEMYPLAVIISHDVLVFDYEDRPDV